MKISASEYGLYLQAFCDAHRGVRSLELHGDVAQGGHLREAVIIALALGDAASKASPRAAGDVTDAIRLALTGLTTQVPTEE